MSIKMADKVVFGTSCLLRLTAIDVTMTTTVKSPVSNGEGRRVDTAHVATHQAPQRIGIVITRNTLGYPVLP